MCTVANLQNLHHLSIHPSELKTLEVEKIEGVAQNEKCVMLGENHDKNHQVIWHLYPYPLLHWTAPCLPRSSVLGLCSSWVVTGKKLPSSLLSFSPSILFDMKYPLHFDV